MSEIKFYITDEERMDLFDYIVSNNGAFHPDLIYDEPYVLKVKNKYELINYINIQEIVRFFILSPSFQTEPMVLRKNQFMEGDKYSIDQRTGGPAIDIAFYLGFAVDAPIKYKRTDLGHYARYMHYNSPTYEEFKASDELKEYYNMIVKFLKSKCRNITALNGKKYWVSKTLSENDVL